MREPLHRSLHHGRGRCKSPRRRVRHRPERSHSNRDRGGICGRRRAGGAKGNSPWGQKEGDACAVKDEVLKDNVTELLKAWGFEVEQLQERAMVRTPDLVATKAGQRFIIELKTKGRDARRLAKEAARMAQGEIVEHGELAGRRGTQAGMIADGVNQILALPPLEADFLTIWILRVAAARGRRRRRRSSTVSAHCQRHGSWHPVPRRSRREPRGFSAPCSGIILFPLGIGLNRLLPRSGLIPEGWRQRLNFFWGEATGMMRFTRRSARRISLAKKKRPWRRGTSRRSGATSSSAWRVSSRASLRGHVH